MADKYDYHKQNDYPGERIAERERVADRREAADRRSDARVAEKGRTDELRADNRVARRGRMDDELMDSEIQRSTARAQAVNRRRNTNDAIWLGIVAVLLAIILIGSVYVYVAMQQQANEINSLNQQIANRPAGSQYNTIAAAGPDTTSPTIVCLSPINSVSPSNNALDVASNIQITAVFSEDMNPSTLNDNTFVVMQRTTPASGAYRSVAIAGTVTYSGRTATFISNEGIRPDQMNGNVFTVTITDGAKDLAGNSLAQNYIWSFSTGGNPFNTGATTSSTG